jgi:hypothetical protein
MATTTETKLVSDELIKLMELVKDSDSIELKVTVPERARQATADVLDVDPLEAQIRQVFFFDTPDLRLNQAGVVARARRIQGRQSDSVVKLRPVVPSELPAEFRKSPNFNVEVDAMPGAYVCSGSMKNLLPSDSVRPAVRGERPLRKLFSKEQRAFFARYAPEDLKIDDLSVLGPIFVLKLKVQPATLSRRLVAEMWLYPDGSRMFELSTKCLPGEGMTVAAEVREFLAAGGVDISGEQATKTKKALAFYSAQLQAQSA